MARQNRTHIDDPVALGHRLRQARHAAGLRLVDLEFDGCSIGYVSHLENGKRVPSLQVVRELATRLGVREAWLAHGEAGESPTAASLLVEGAVAARLDDRPTAAALYRDALDVARSDQERARARAGLANLTFLGGDPRAAIEEFEASLELDPELEADPGFADALGRAYAHVGEMESAIAVFRRRLAAAVAERDAVERTRFAVLLSNALIDSSRLTEASAVLEQLLVEAAGADDPVTLARVHWSQSRLHALRQDSVSAARHARKALDILEATDYLQQRSRAHHLLAYIELDAGRTDEALSLIERGRELAACGGSAFDLAKFDIEEARARALTGELSAAADLAMRASQVLAAHHPIDVGRCFGEIAGIVERSGDLPRARELYELALDYLGRQVPNPILPATQTRYADVLERLGERDLAFATYKRAALARGELAQTSSATSL